MSQNTMYGAAVVLVKGDAIYLCRRGEGALVFPKKWQFVNTHLKHIETSIESAVRAIKEQTNLNVDKQRLCFIDWLNIDSTNEYYYVHAVNLKPDEFPENTDSDVRGDWRAYPLNKAIVLDVVPGIRSIMIKLYRSHKTISDKENEYKYLETLGPKMTTHNFGA
jgi:ADP-ribose pyrophosphatase YjhB (NUDIX family)